MNRVFDDQDALTSGAMDVAQRLANGPRSLALIRKAYWNTWQNAYEQQLDLEAQLQNEAGRSADFKEGVRAFVEKRDARLAHVLHWILIRFSPTELPPTFVPYTGDEVAKLRTIGVADAARKRHQLVQAVASELTLMSPSQ